MGIAIADVSGNELIAANVAPGRYITFFYAVVDTERMRVDYCSAGHNPPLLRHPDNTTERLGEGGPVLGVFPDASYNNGSAQLGIRDCLLLYTDGITEAVNAEGEEFGEERLAGVVNEAAGSADGCRERIMQTVAEFSGGIFHDDATLLTAQIK